MKRLKIKNINNYEYLLVDNHNKNYNLNLEFYGSNFKPKVGDIIYINDKLLFKNEMYSFGVIGSEFGKRLSNTDDEELIIVETNNNKIYLQRYYG